MLSDLVKSKFFTRIAVAALVLVVIFLGKELKKHYKIKQEIQNLQKEILSLEAKNQETLELVNYFQTREFQERQARSLLNLQKPGELVVALPFQESAAPASKNLDESETSNLRKWWEYFLGKSQ